VRTLRAKEGSMVDVPGSTRQIRSLVGETGEVRVSI